MVSLQSKCLYYLSLDGVKIIILSYVVCVVCEHYIVHSDTGSQSCSGPGHVLHIQNVTVQTGSRQALQSVDTNRDVKVFKVLIQFNMVFIFDIYFDTVLNKGFCSK